MTVRKRVSDEVFEKITSAIKRIETDPSLRPTKRQIEHLTGLSHDAVARAFRQDANNDGKPWGITEQLNRLSGGERGRSPHEEQVDALRKELVEKNATIRELQDTLDAYATALYAFAVNHATGRTQRDQDAVPIGRNRAK